MANKIVLTINSIKLDGWKSAKVTKSMESCAGSFELELVSLNTYEQFLLMPQLPCTISIDNDILINGFIDKVIPSATANGFTYNISGRDKTEDIIDCGIEDAPAEWTTTFEKFAKILCKKHNISVVNDGTISSKVATFTIDTGETVFEALKNGARSFKILLMPNHDGNLLLGTAGDLLSYDSLIFGRNIKEFTYSADASNRYHKYLIKAQRKTGGNPWADDGNLHIFGEAIDEQVRSNRVKVLSADGIQNNKTAKIRATWEATTRAGKSEQLSCVVVNFRQSNGELWNINKQVNVLIDSPCLYLKTKLLITSITYLSNSDTGNTCAMVLKNKNTYDEFDTPKVKKSKGDTKSINFLSGDDLKKLLDGLRKKVGLKP